MNGKCKGCKYVTADIYSPASNPYLCANEDSPNFGEKVGAGCDAYERFEPRPNMSLYDAMKMIIELPNGAYPGWSFRFGRTGESNRPAYFISFESNKQMFLYREAMLRCFEELMDSYER